MKLSALFFLYFLSWSQLSSADVMAMAHSWSWTVSLESTGEPHTDNCVLRLVAETYQARREINIKDSFSKCSLFGPRSLIVTDNEDRSDTYVFLEAARGGDGSHSGPIVQIFRINKQGFIKLGEKQLFEASYHRTGELITSVTGKVIFPFCATCDGPQSGDENDFYVPVRMTVGCGGLCITPTMSKQEREQLLARFVKRKSTAGKDFYIDAYYLKHVENLERDLRKLLAQ